MKELTPERRSKIARELSIVRDVWRQQAQPGAEHHEKRDRPADIYLTRLRGLDATLEYARSLPSNIVVDMGAGSARATGAIAHSRYGKGLDFVATDIIPDPKMREHMGGRRGVRITSAEVMRGFETASVGCIISVYGGFEQTNNLDVVLEKADELLVPGGVAKFCLQYETEAGNPNRMLLNAKYSTVREEIQNFFIKNGYGLAQQVTDFGKRGKNITFLVIKPKDQEDETSEKAQSLMRQDFHDMEKMRKALKSV